MSTVVFSMTGMPDGFRPVKAPAVAVAPSLAPGATAEATLAVHTPQAFFNPIPISAQLKYGLRALQSLSSMVCLARSSPECGETEDADAKVEHDRGRGVDEDEDEER